VLFSLILTLSVAAFQQPPCQPGQVLEVNRGRDYTLNICGIGVVALRGAEPPLASASGHLPLGRTPPGVDRSLPVSGEVLGKTDIGPEALDFLRELFAGKRVTISEDGWRMGDPGGRTYVYAFLPDKTLVNAELIRRGFAYADRQGAHPRRDHFIALEEGARRQKLGVWKQ
jgi:Staphylococcal nuclease homologue